jgi:hypothetical protein
MLEKVWFVYSHLKVWPSLHVIIHCSLLTSERLGTGALDYCRYIFVEVIKMDSHSLLQTHCSLVDFDSGTSVVDNSCILYDNTECTYCFLTWICILSSLHHVKILRHSSQILLLHYWSVLTQLLHWSWLSHTLLLHFVCSLYQNDLFIKLCENNLLWVV